MLFPHETVRPEQQKLINDVQNAIEKKKSIIVHAPTGMGKTAATISPAIEYAIKNKLTVFFLTSRLTQHKIAIETAKKIIDRHDIRLSAIDIVGKKHMCLVEGAQLMHGSEFTDFCKTAREKGTCAYYTKTKNGNDLTFDAKIAVEKMRNSPQSSEEIVDESRKSGICPYYTSLELASSAQMIIADYNHLFNPSIRTNFLKKISKEIEKSIFIIDEAHNIPERIRSALSDRLQSSTIRNAISEAKKYKFDIIPVLSGIQDILNRIGSQKEQLVEKDEFASQLNKLLEYDELTALFKTCEEVVHEDKKRSWIGSIANFLEKWKGPDDGFSRILSVSQKNIVLSYNCLDPAPVSSEVINKAHSTILMSATMNPTEMYKNLLGIENCEEVEYENPFPKENRLNLIVPFTTTKFQSRNDRQFFNIAAISSTIANSISGNVAIFFPSYDLKEKVHIHLSSKCNKTIFSEFPGMTKNERKELLDKFASCKNAVLLAVTGGSFAEGIDMPGVLQGVIIVGIPLPQPDLYTKEIVRHYQEEFGNGADYGYFLPAINKALQAAGRCIRSEKDKGVIIFLDERYANPFYRRFLPDDFEVVSEYGAVISQFFNE